MRLVFIAALAAGLAAQQTGSITTGSIVGKTVDAGLLFVPFPSVGVISATPSFPGMNKDGDKSGAFKLSGIPPGSYLFAAKVRGLREIVRPVRVEAGKETNLGSVLLPAGSCEDPGVTCAANKNATTVPILSVCDALRKRDAYFSQSVILVGRLSETRRESTLTADCPFALATGAFAWSNSIAVSDAAGARLPVLPKTFKWDVKALNAVKKSIGAPESEKLAAVFGRFESPAGLVTLDCPRRVNCSHGTAALPIPPALLVQDAPHTSRYLE